MILFARVPATCDYSGPKNNAGGRHRASGFTLLEMAMVMAITIIVALYAVLGLVPVLNQQRVTNGYNTTMAAMRLARDNTISSALPIP